VTMRRLPDDAAPKATVEPTPARDVVVMRVLQDPTQPQGVPTAAPPPATWTIAPGDHLWKVAAETLAHAWSRPPTDAEVLPYWVAVIARNRHALADPTNPDLVFPGQVIELPNPPGRP
jgi:nucleoid-associated protein YgaU